MAEHALYEKVRFDLSIIYGEPRSIKRGLLAAYTEARAGAFMRVAGDNARVRHVYEASGFGVTGINMSKSIKRE